MQVDERPQAEARRDGRWRGAVIGIAAAAAVLMGGLIFVNTDDVATPAPNAIPVPEDMPAEPGAYYVDTDGDEEGSIRGTFVIEGEGWSGFTDGALKEADDDGEGYVSLVIVEVDEVYTTICQMSGRGPLAAGATAESLANQFAGNGLIVREPPAPVTAFGHEGHKLIMEVPPGCAETVNQAWNGGLFEGRYYQGEGQVLEYYFLDVEGTPVMVEASWFPTSSDEDLAELHAVLDTLVITP